ncbi:hypothetical protein [Aureimonas sp. ME7]|uniref:phage tail assembly chaperone n=1 Tax=Aureimonas sp. ME7 TaxID=2744252 RepID=UPI0015F5D4EA|nr:hypothetical protein [Aureimonas sp. ME7]
MIEWGDKVEWLREMVPDSPHLASQPDIGPLEEFIWSMFWSLHAGRQIGMSGYQAIPVVEVMAYCALAGITDASERMLLLRLMQVMDREMLAVLAKKADKDRKRGK